MICFIKTKSDSNVPYDLYVCCRHTLIIKAYMTMNSGEMNSATQQLNNHEIIEIHTSSSALFFFCFSCKYVIVNVIFL